MGPFGAVKKAKIIVVNVANHRKVKETSTDAGTFGPVQLAPGVYRVEIKRHCFKKYSREVTLSGDQILRVDVALEKTCGPPAIMQ